MNHRPLRTRSAFRLSAADPAPQQRRGAGLRRLACSLVLASMPALGADAAASLKPVQRCGWFENPTPANAWLTDRDGQWTIATQGGAQAEGDWPQFRGDQWVATNGSYGRGCACMKVVADRATMEIRRIVSASARPLAACRRDPALKEPRD